MAILTAADPHTAATAIVGTLPPGSSPDGAADRILRSSTSTSKRRTIRITHANSPSAASRATGALIALSATDPNLDKAA